MLDVIISLSVTVLVFSILVLCLGRNAARHDIVKERLDKLSSEVTRAALAADNELDKPFTDRVIRPIIQKISGLLSSLMPRRTRNTDSKQEKMLQQSGWIITIEEYSVIQLILMIGCAAIGLVLAIILDKDIFYIILYFIIGAFAGYAALRYLCSAAATRRKNAMEKQLPDLLDLLSVSVAAGLGFERALLHVIESMDGPLVDEFAVTCREMSMGRSRKDALTLLGERCGIEDLTTVTGALVQAGQLGIPISNVLQSQSEAIRNSRRSKVKEKAAKVSTKMLLPMVGLIFPVLIIILLGPSLITILEQFSL